MKRNLRKHYRGCYRVTMSDDHHFAQIQRASPDSQGIYHPTTDGREWLVAIRVIETGNLVRFSGVYPTLYEALVDIDAPKYL